MSHNNNSSPISISTIYYAMAIIAMLLSAYKYCKPVKPIPKTTIPIVKKPQNLTDSQMIQSIFKNLQPLKKVSCNTELTDDEFEFNKKIMKKHFKATHVVDDYTLSYEKGGREQVEFDCVCKVTQANIWFWLYKKRENLCTQCGETPEFLHFPNQPEMKWTTSEEAFGMHGEAPKVSLVEIGTNKYELYWHEEYKGSQGFDDYPLYIMDIRTGKILFRASKEYTNVPSGMGILLSTESDFYYNPTKKTNNYYDIFEYMTTTYEKTNNKTTTYNQYSYNTDTKDYQKVFSKTIKSSKSLIVK